MISLRHLFAFLALLVTAALLPGTAAIAQSAPPSAAVTAPAAPPAAPVTMNDGYLLGPGDMVEVAVLGRSDYLVRVQVQVDGSVQLPLINDVPAANRTVLQFRSDVRAALIAGGFFTDPAVSVTVASYASRYITVLGEVATPGIVPIDRAYHLSEVLARVGGTRPTAADQIVLTHSDGQSATLDMVAVATGNPSQDVTVSPGDRIYVAAAPQFYIYGQVNAPGSYRLDRNMTLRMALARGGGLTAQGSERRIKVIRDGQEMLHFDPNALLRPADTVVVGERFF